MEDLQLHYGALQAEEEGIPDVADARDGWDFDSDFEPPDTVDAVAASGSPQGDQGWVGFGAPTDVSAAVGGGSGMKERQGAHAERLPNHRDSSSSQHVTKVTRTVKCYYSSSAVHQTRVLRLEMNVSHRADWG